MTDAKITAEIETEAAIYAEGTSLTKADILKAYSQHLATADEPLDIQRFCETVLVISENYEPTQDRINLLADEAAQHGDLLG
jgi:glycyl-tRNA synthetase beta subunit